MNIQGKRVLITGGTSGIGLATATALLAKGAKVFVTGRRPDVLASALETLRAGGGFAEGMAADVMTEQGRKFTLKSAIDAFGGLDILINNAGGEEPDALKIRQRRKS